MIRNEITNVRLSYHSAPGHGHIIAVKYSDRIVAVETVYNLILSGQYEFYTYSPSTGKTALVHTLECCGEHTLRSAPDAVKDNNLDDLPPC